MAHKTLAVGIDVSKLKHDVAIMTSDKKLLCRTFVIRENRVGYRRLLDRLGDIEKKHQVETFYIGMEATADYWKNLYHFLREQSNLFRVIVINPVRTKAFAKTELRRAKTDPVNAKDIAQFMIEKQPDSQWIRPPIFENIKDVDRQLIALKKKRTITVNRLRMELAKVAPELEHKVRNILGQQILALLAHFPTAETIANAAGDELENVSYGKKQWRLPETFIAKMKRLSERSIGHKKGPGAGLVVRSLVRCIAQYQDEIELLKEQLKKLYEKVNKDESLLTSITGVALETAIVLEAYIGDVNRFSSAKKIVAYFGLNPTINLSGKGKRASYMEKKGSSIVRQKLYMATLSLIRCKQEPIYSYYQRLVTAGKPKMSAIGAAMRKLMVIMYVMLKKRQKFNAPEDTSS